MKQEQSQSIPKELLNTSPKGFSLVEVILSAALFGMLALALVSAYLYGMQSTALAGSRARAVFLSDEGLQAVQNISDEDFAFLNDGTYGLSTTSNQWDFLGSSDTTDIFSRNIVISAVDEFRKQITSNISWQQNVQRAGSVSATTYITNWQRAVPISGCNDTATLAGYDSGTCRQNSTQCTVNGEDYLPDGDEFCVGGPFANTCCALPVVTPPSGTCNDHAVSLGYSTGTCRENSIQCVINSEDYLAGGDVYCTGGPSTNTCCGLPVVVASCSGTATTCGSFGDLSDCTAQTGCSWGSGGASGSTANPSFDTNLSGWSYYDWDQNSGEVDATGTRNSSGGNPNGWVDINFPAGKNDELGGYWQQSFTTTVTNPIVTLDFDWMTSLYDPTPITFILYVFVDSASGAPTIGQEVWSSGEQTATSSWASQINLDVSSKVSAVGTYYLKMAVWVETDGGSNDGPYEIGYDNVQLDWIQTDACSGTPNACTTFADQPNCEAQGGCLWN